MLNIIVTYNYSFKLRFVNLGNTNSLFSFLDNFIYQSIIRCS